jgi:hypothetical protein
MIDRSTRTEIGKITSRILNEAGMRDPPFLVEDLLAHLELYRGFYDLTNPSFIRRVWHKLRVGGKKISDIAGKICLCAVWFPDERKFLVDESLPVPKKDWASFHDTTHTVLPWHKEFFLGDTAQTLDPDFQEMLESEAHYGASAFMFGGQLFTKEALELVPQWESVQLLKKRYKKSWVTTVRRFVEFSHLLPMAMVVSTAKWDIKPPDQEHRGRHFVGSELFKQQFSCVTRDWVTSQIDINTRKRVGGPVGDFGLAIKDLNGALHQFRAESFYNRHYIITLLVSQRKPILVTKPHFGIRIFPKLFGT